MVHGVLQELLERHRRIVNQASVSGGVLLSIAWIAFLGFQLPISLDTRCQVGLRRYCSGRCFSTKSRISARVESFM